MALALVVAASCAGAASCASAKPYNPGNLGASQLGRVAQICQSVMGLSPSDPTSNVWGPASNYYEGCVANLSDFLNAASSADFAVQADHDCHAKGLQSGTPELAECVLRSEQTRPASAAPGNQNIVLTPVRDGPRIRPYSNAGAGERTRRVQLACARLGLNPVDGAFANCVMDMKDTFESIDDSRD